jgi:hypothetical protein
MSKLSLTAFMFLAAGTAHAQVIINEVYTNPPGGGSVDNQWEYIELYGKPGMSLTGYMIASVFGGADPDNDNIPGPRPDSSWDRGDEVPEIDEAYSLDGLTIGSNGFLVLYNNQASNSQIPALLPAATNRATFGTSHVPSGDVAGRIKNDGSATIVLIRRRPFHSVNAGGISVYDGFAANTLTSGPTYPAGIRYGWRKDVGQDINFNGRIDLNGVGQLVSTLLPPPPEAPVQSEDPLPLGSVIVETAKLEPYQMIDDLAWSNGGGKEYVRSSQQELSDTSGFNPDAISRVNFFFTNPNLGDRLDSSSAVVPTRMADEEFIYGDIPAVPANLYDPVLSSGPTIAGQTPGSRFNRLTGAGFVLTPGNFNDGTASGTAITQRRIVTGDINFSGTVDCDDYTLAQTYLGATLDDTTTRIEDQNTLATIDDVQLTNAYKWEGRAAQSLLATLFLNTTDGPSSTNNLAVTAADLDALLALIPGGCATTCPCVADFDNSGGTPDAGDIDAFFTAWLAGDETADADCSGGTPDAGDIDTFFAQWLAGGC